MAVSGSAFIPDCIVAILTFWYCSCVWFCAFRYLLSLQLDLFDSFFFFGRDTVQERPITQIPSAENKAKGM